MGWKAELYHLGCLCPGQQQSHKSSSEPHYGWCILRHPASAVGGWRTSCTPHTWRDLMNTGENTLNLVWGCTHRPFIIISPKLSLSLSLCTADGEVKAAQAVSWQRVCPTLKDHGTGLVHLHHLGHHLWEHSAKSPVTLSWYMSPFSPNCVFHFVALVKSLSVRPTSMICDIANSLEFWSSAQHTQWTCGNLMPY